MQSELTTVIDDLRVSVGHILRNYVSCTRLTG
jgi:hypothetical protein